MNPPNPPAETPPAPEPPVILKSAVAAQRARFASEMLVAEHEWHQALNESEAKHQVYMELLGAVQACDALLKIPDQKKPTEAKKSP